MDKNANLEQLLKEYGYPIEAIDRFMKDVESLDYEEAKQRIMPYKDITADRS